MRNSRVLTATCPSAWPWLKWGVHTNVFYLVTISPLNRTIKTPAANINVSAQCPTNVCAKCTGNDELLYGGYHVVKFGICTHRFSLAVSRRSASVSLPPASVCVWERHCVYAHRRHSQSHCFPFFLKGHDTWCSTRPCVLTGFGTNRMMFSRMSIF